MSWKKHNKLTWPGFSSSSSFSSSFFPVGKLLIPDSDIMSNNLGEALFFADLHNTQHFYTSFLACQKSTGAKKNLNISIVGRQACLPASSFGMQRSNFKSFLRSIDKSNDYHHQGVDIKNRHQCVGKIVKKNKVSSVCSYNPIQAKKSFLWVTFLRGFQV